MHLQLYPYMYLHLYPRAHRRIPHVVHFYEGNDEWSGFYDRFSGRRGGPDCGFEVVRVERSAGCGVTFPHALDSRGPMSSLARVFFVHTARASVGGSSRLTPSFMRRSECVSRCETKEDCDIIIKFIDIIYK